MESKKALVYKIIILLLGMGSLFCLYTGKIYIYDTLSIKSYSLQIWIGIILWILFIINASILTIKMNEKVENKILRLKNIFRNYALLLLITVLLIYKIYNGVLTIYKMSNKSFNTGIYISFGIVFIAYFGISLFINRLENTEKEKTLNKKSKNKKR